MFPQWNSDTELTPTVLNWRWHDRQVTDECPQGGAPQGKTIYNTYNSVPGDDDWDPMHVKSFLKEAEENLKENLTNIPVCLKLESTSGEIRTGGKEVVREGQLPCDSRLCCVMQSNAHGSDRPDSALSVLEQTDGSRIQSFTSNQDETANGMIKATSEGLEVSTVLSVSQVCCKHRNFSMPKLEIRNGGRMKGIHSDLAGRKDCSFISWYHRCSDSKGNNAVLAGCCFQT